MMDQPAEGREGKESLHRRFGNTVLNYGRANKAHLNLSWQETKKTRRDERWMEGWRDGGRVGASRCATTREGERRKKMKETHSRAKEGNTHTHTLLHTLSSPQHTHTSNAAGWLPVSIHRNVNGAQPSQTGRPCSRLAVREKQRECRRLV